MDGSDSPPRVPLNVDLLRQRAAEIREAVSVLAGYREMPKDLFLADARAIDAAKYRLIVAIEAAISICTHVAARRANRTPDSYADCFSILGAIGVIPAPLAGSLGRMARFRNLLVHVYWEIDNGKVWDVLRDNLADLDAYLQCIAAVKP